MDLEQLTLILETIQSMGGDAKNFGIWWMVCTTFPRCLSSLLLFAFGVLVIKLVFKIAKVVSTDNLEAMKHATDEEIKFKKLYSGSIGAKSG